MDSQHLWDNHFSFHDSKHAEFARRYLAKCSRCAKVRDRAREDTVTVYRFSTDDTRWQRVHVRQTDHKRIVDEIIEDASWRNSVLTPHQIPVSIHRLARRVLPTLFPQMRQMDPERQPPEYIEGVLNSRRYVQYAQSLKGRDPMEMGGLDACVAADEDNDWNDPECQTTTSTVNSEFSSTSPAKQLLFLNDASTTELRVDDSIANLPFCPYAISATVFTMAFCLCDAEGRNSVLEHYCHIRSYLADATQRNVDLPDQPSAIVARRICKVLLQRSDTLQDLFDISEDAEPLLDEKQLESLPTLQEISNTLDFFHDIRALIDDSVHCRRLSFGIVPIHERIGLNQFLILREHASPSEMYASILMLCAKYLPNVEFRMSFDSEHICVALTQSTLQRVQRLVIPHMIATRKFVNAIRPKTILYPLLTWNYLYGDDESIAYCMQTLLCYVRQLKTYPNPSKTDMHPSQRLFHALIARMFEDLDTLFSAPFMRFEHLKFGLSKRTTRKRLRAPVRPNEPCDEVFNRLGNDTTDRLFGFHAKTKNIYTALEAYIRMDENCLSISEEALYELSEILNRNHLTCQLNFPALTQWVFNHYETCGHVRLPDRDLLVEVPDVEISDELYHLCATTLVSQSAFERIFFGMHHCVRGYRLEDFKVSKISTRRAANSDTVKQVERQPHLRKMEWKDFQPERTKMCLEQSQVEQIFQFFRTGEQIAKYPAEDFTLVQLREHIATEAREPLIEPKTGLPYRGDVTQISEFEQEAYDASQCVDPENPPNITVTNDCLGLFDSFVKVVLPSPELKLSECVTFNHSEELPPVVDFHPDFLHTLTTNPCTYVSLRGTATS